MSYPDGAGRSAGDLQLGQLVKVGDEIETIVAADGFSAITDKGTLIGCGVSFEVVEGLAKTIELSKAAKDFLNNIGTLENVEAAVAAYSGD